MFQQKLKIILHLIKSKKITMIS